MEAIKQFYRDLFQDWYIGSIGVLLHILVLFIAFSIVDASKGARHYQEGRIVDKRYHPPRDYTTISTSTDEKGHIHTRVVFHHDPEEFIFEIKTGKHTTLEWTDESTYSAKPIGTRVGMSLWIGYYTGLCYSTRIEHYLR